MKAHTVGFIVEWTEHEHKVGSKPDGWSLHLTRADVDAYIEAYEPHEDPEDALCFTVQPEQSGDTAKMVGITKDGYEQICEMRDHNSRDYEHQKYGVRFWDDYTYSLFVVDDEENDDFVR